MMQGAVEEAFDMAEAAQKVLNDKNTWTTEIRNLLKYLLLGKDSGNAQDANVSIFAARFQGIAELLVRPGTAFEPKSRLDIKVYCGDMSRWQERTDGSLYDMEHDYVTGVPDDVEKCRDNAVISAVTATRRTNVKLGEMYPHQLGITVLRLQDIAGAATLDLCPAWWAIRKDELTAYWDIAHPGKRARVSSWFKPKGIASSVHGNPVDASGNSLAKIILHEFTHTWAAGLAKDHAYHWDDCVALANDPQSRERLNENADTLALFAHALRFIQGTWSGKKATEANYFEVREDGSLVSITEPGPSS